MRYVELLESSSSGDFDSYLVELLRHLESLKRLLPVLGRRPYIIRFARAVIAQSRMAKPANEGDEMLLESVIELYEELIQQAGGQPPAPP